MRLPLQNQFRAQGILREFSLQLALINQTLYDKGSARFAQVIVIRHHRQLAGWIGVFETTASAADFFVEGNIRHTSIGGCDLLHLCVQKSWTDDLMLRGGARPIPGDRIGEKPRQGCVVLRDGTEHDYR